MKRVFLLFIIIFSFQSCKKAENKSVEKDWIILSNRLKYQENAQELSLISGDKTYKIAHSKLPFKKVIFLNSSLIGFITELKQEDKIVGVSSPEYICSEKIHQLISQGKIANVGNEQKYDVEKIIALKPNVIFTNHVESFGNTYDLLKKNGIEIIFLDEYLEQNPLEKSDYIKVFGKLLGSEKESEEISKNVHSNYAELTKLAAKAPYQPLVITNEMFGNQWFLPGGKTFMAKFIKDANANYILKDNSDEKSVPKSFEEVFAKAENAEFWVNAGNHNAKSELLAMNPNYAKMKVFQKGKIYTMTTKANGKANDYFESGIVRADLVLKDYIKMFHPELLPQYQFTYMKELK